MDYYVPLDVEIANDNKLKDYMCLYAYPNGDIEDIHNTSSNIEETTINTIGFNKFVFSKEAGFWDIMDIFSFGQKYMYYYYMI